MNEWRPGLRVAGFELQAELGRGGWGVVYRALDVSTGQLRAIKTLDLAASPSARERFLREGQAQALVDQHPNVVRVYAAGEAAGRGYLVLDLVSGGDLATRLRAGPLAIEEARRVALEIGRALEHAHAQGVLHRDLKPANVLFHEGRAQLVDFGLARLASEGTITKTGEILGTPGFMSPEQADGAKGVGPLSDVYGLGALLYAALTGEPPFRGGSMVEVLAGILRRPAQPPSLLRAEVPSDLDAICLRALAKEPDERFPSVSAMIEALEGHASEAPSASARGPLALGLAFSGLVLAAGAIYALPAQGPPPSASPVERASAAPASPAATPGGRWQLRVGDRLRIEFEWEETNEILYRSEVAGRVDLEVVACEARGYRVAGEVVLSTLRGSSGRGKATGGDAQLGALDFPQETLSLAEGRRELSALLSREGTLSEARGLLEVRRLLRSKAPKSVEILEGQNPESEAAYLLRRIYDPTRLCRTLSAVLDPSKHPWRERSGGRLSLQTGGARKAALPNLRTDAEEGAVFSLRGKGRVSESGVPSLRLEQVAQGKRPDPIRTSFGARVSLIRAR